MTEKLLSLLAKLGADEKDVRKALPLLNRTKDVKDDSFLYRPLARVPERYLQIADGMMYNDDDTAFCLYVMTVLPSKERSYILGSAEDTLLAHLSYRKVRHTPNKLMLHSILVKTWCRWLARGEISRSVVRLSPLSSPCDVKWIYERGTEKYEVELMLKPYHGDFCIYCVVRDKYNAEIAVLTKFLSILLHTRTRIAISRIIVNDILRRMSVATSEVQQRELGLLLKSVIALYATTVPSQDNTAK